MLLLCNVLRLEHTLSLATHYPTTHSRHQFSILFLFNPLSSPWFSSLLFALLFSFSLVLFLPHPSSFLLQRLYYFLLRCSADGLIDRHSRESVNRLHRERALVIRGRRNARQRTITSFVFLPLLKYVSPTLYRRSPVVTLFFFSLSTTERDERKYMYTSPRTTSCIPLSTRSISPIYPYLRI